LTIKTQKTLKAFALCSGFFALTYLNACREHETLDPSLVPGVDNINTFGLTESDLDISTHVVHFDSQLTNNRSLPIGALGQLEGDPFFGDIDAGFFLQFTVPSVGYQFPDSIRSFDSVRLVLPYTGATYGDTAGVTNIEVYEINDPSFTIDTSMQKYYAFSNVDYYPTPIGFVEKRLHDVRKDTIVYSTSTSVVSQLVIRLNPATLAKFSSMDASKTHDHYAFVDYFNGVYIKANGVSPDHKKSLHYFLLANSGSSSSYNQARLEVHFTKLDGTIGITIFPFNNKYSSFFSKLTRNFSGYPVEAYTSGMASDSFFVQGGPGMQTDVTIRNLHLLSKTDKVYAARLVINMPVTSIYDKLKYPPILLVNGVNDDGTLYAIADYETSSDKLGLAEEFVGGRPAMSLIDGQEHMTYYINIPREIQRHAALGKDSLKLRVYPYYDYIGAYRLIAPGFNSPSAARARFNIVYGK